MPHNLLRTRILRIILLFAVIAAVFSAGFSLAAPGDMHTLSVDIPDTDYQYLSEDSATLTQTVSEGETAQVFWTFKNNMRCTDLLVKIGYFPAQSIGTMTNSGTIFGMDYTLTATTSATNMPGFRIEFQNLTQDITITPVMEYTANIHTGSSARVAISGSTSRYIARGGSTTVEWSLIGDDTAMDSLVVSIGDNTAVIKGTEGSITVGSTTYPITSNGTNYSMTISDLKAPLNVTINAVGNIFVGGSNFKTVPDVVLTSFVADTGHAVHSGFNLHVYYTTQVDGSVQITHTASSATYHGGKAKLISQSHASGTVLQNIDKPITIQVTVQCTQGCGYTDTVSLTIPYRAANFVFKDELDNTISPPSGWQTTCYVMDNRTWSAEAPTLDWYDYVPTHTLNKTKDGTVTREGDDKIIYFSLAKDENATLTLRYLGKARTYFEYVDEMGQAVHFDDATTVVNGYRNDVVGVPIPSKPWYRYVNTTETTTTATPSGTLSNDTELTLNLMDATTFTRNYMATAEVKVRYVDELGNDLSPILPDTVPLVISGDRASVHDVMTPDIYSYEYTGMEISTPEGEIASGTLDTYGRQVTLNHGGASTITVKYQGKASVKVNYIDDEGNDVNAIFTEIDPENVKLLLAGDRGKNFPVYHADEIGDYTYDHMELSHNANVELPEDKIIPPDARERMSVEFDEVTGEGTFKLYDTAVITVVYNYRGTVWMEYEDEFGSDLTPRLTEPQPTFIEGYHKREANIPTPDIDFFEFAGYDLVTRPGERPSGYIDGPQDSTVTFGVRDASTLTVQYRGWAIVNLKYVDDHGNDISSVFGIAAIPQIRGYRYDETDIPTPENRWYEFKRYDIETNIDAECPSGYIDNNRDSTVTFGLKDQTTVTVVYHAKADIKMTYVDELGNNIWDLFDKTPPSVIRGLRDANKDIPTPELDWYKWQYYILSTTEDAVPSGYVDDQYDTTATFGHKDASHIAVVYHAHADVPFIYEDTKGNDLMELGILPENTIEIMRGNRGEEFEFDIPNLNRFELQSVKLIRTRPDSEVPSAVNLQKDGLYKAEYNLGDGGTMQVLYDPLPLTLELTDPHGTELMGGEIVITNGEGKEVYSASSDYHGEYSVPALGAGEYYVTEIDAPDGYYLSSAPWSFSLDNANEPHGTLKYINHPIIKTVICLDGNTNQPISGAVIGVYNSNNQLIAQAETNAEGKTSFWLQKDGHYTLKQVSVPEPYMMSGEIHTVNITGKTVDNGNNTYTIRNVPPVQTGAEPKSLIAQAAAFIAAATTLAGGQALFIRRRI